MADKDNRGITLSELLTVITIIAILSSIAVLKINDYVASTKLDSAIRMLDADIRKARWLARTTSKKCVVSFNALAGTYSINNTYFAKIPEGIWFGVDHSVTGKPSNPYDAPPSDGITFDKDNKASFSPTGYVTPTGSIFLTDGRETVALTIAITGRPKIWKSLGGRRWRPL